VTGGILLQWSEPDDHSDAILAYRIEAQNSALTWIEVCDGSDTTVVSGRTCLFPMSTFSDPEQFNIAFLHLVRFRVTAQNINGWGATSESNEAGATVRTVPRFMNFAQRDPETDNKQIFVFWSPISSVEQTGDAEIISYGIEWDDGSDGEEWH
jgi:hypothetical protein